MYIGAVGERVRGSRYQLMEDNLIATTLSKADRRLAHTSTSTSYPWELVWTLDLTEEVLV